MPAATSAPPTALATMADRTRAGRGRGRRQTRPDVEALRQLRRARDRIDRDYAEPLPIATLAAGAGYSAEHFIRAFRRAYGQTPGRYRTARRVERACALLRSEGLTVTEVCALVGFASLGAFSARFAKVMGCSPAAYRRQAAQGPGMARIPGCFAFMGRAGRTQATGADNAAVSKKRSPAG